MKLLYSFGLCASLAAGNAIVKSESKSSNALSCQRACESTQELCARLCFADQDCISQCGEVRQTCDIQCGAERKGGAILVVHSNEGNTPVLFDSQGKKSTLTKNWTFESRTGAFRSCSAVVNGRMMVFGGQSVYENQISEVSSCALKRIGDLPMSFYYGACNVYSGKALLCFDYYAENTCHTYDGRQVQASMSSNYPHSLISLASFRNMPMAVGSGDPDNKVVELMGGIWTVQPDFPYVSNRYYFYSTATYNGNALFFGGKGDNSAYTLDIAVQFDGTWSEIGKLKTPRYQHRSIANGNSIMHVGGFGSQHFEEWTPSGSSWNIKNWSATLYYYNMYPELFTVDQNYCL